MSHPASVIVELMLETDGCELCEPPILNRIVSAVEATCSPIRCVTSASPIQVPTSARSGRRRADVLARLLGAAIVGAGASCPRRSIASLGQPADLFGVPSSGQLAAGTSPTSTCSTSTDCASVSDLRHDFPDGTGRLRQGSTATPPPSSTARCHRSRRAHRRPPRTRAARVRPLGRSVAREALEADVGTLGRRDDRS